MIELDRVTKRYGDRAVVDGVSLLVPRGTVLALLGGSGSGKTTTLKMINRLVEPTSGHIRIDGRDTLDVAAHELRRSLGYVIQEIGLFPHMTISENVGVTPRLLGWDQARIDRRVRELLALVELEPGEFAERFPAQLSGGQRQRVGIARALAAEPSVMLLDEPFGALDPITRRTLQRMMLRIWRERELTAVVVTHDVKEAMFLGTQIAVMKDGKLLQMGTPDEVTQAPKDDYVRGLLFDELPATDRPPHHSPALPS
ncbi:MAG: ABC transporter ATP-binding protein [Polyangiaceae bacterium]|nr:ABC transporter ATP-binding protein [Polyangiaceae bacterium]